MQQSIASVTVAISPAAARDAARWRAAFWTMWAVALAVKVLLAARLAPFGDEAWYWQESRALDLSYSDLPPATAVLIRVGELLGGHSVLAMRLPFLLLGAATPLLLVRLAADLFGARAGWQAGLIALILPLTATLGIFALPDVPLTFCAAAAMAALERAARTHASREWAILGMALAAAWLSHYRAAALIAAGLLFLAATERGRSLWRDRGLWLALAISALGLVPVLVYNATHAWVALGFQLIERNPWQFHADGLLQPLEQAVVCTPLLYALLLAVGWTALRRARAGAPWDLLAACAIVPIAGYFVLGCFADDTRLRLHWPLPGYLPLVVAAPVVLRTWRADAHRPTAFAVTMAATFAVALVGCIAAYGYFALAAVPGGARALERVKAFPEHWVGWEEVSEQTRLRLSEPRFAEALLVADNFTLAAELDFAFDGSRPVYTLDHPLNAKHGRAPQLAAWQRDEAALRAPGARHLLLVAEPTTRRERDRAQWLSSLCTRVARLERVGTLELYGGRKRYLFFSATTREAGAPVESVDDCATAVR